MSFTYDDEQSPTGKKVRAHLLAELESARLDNDNTTYDERTTWLLRGRIKQLKALVAFVTPMPPPE